MVGRKRWWLVGSLVLAVLALPAPPSAGQSPAPRVASGSSDWRSVTAGLYHTCGIRSSGRLYCWGDDEWGQLGDDAEYADKSTPTEVQGGFTDWVQVSSSGNHTCARRRPGRLYCWGLDIWGQMGNGPAASDSPTPVRVGTATNWVDVGAGVDHTCGRRSTGRLYCWGKDTDGQLGDDSTFADRQSPTQVAGDRTDWAKVTGGRFHTCALRTTGRLFCWGDDSEGQVGDGSTFVDRPTPVQVAGKLTAWTTVSAGRTHTCARLETGALRCWGYDALGNLGNGEPRVDEPVPVAVAGKGTWSTVDSGRSHVCARRTSGRMFCWGSNEFGQIGLGFAGGSEAAPSPVVGGATDWATISAGEYHTCARTVNNRLYCFGLDDNGQLGDGGTNTDQPGPVEVQV